MMKFDRLQKLGIQSPAALLEYFPIGYVDASHVVTIADCPTGELVTVCGVIQNIKSTRAWKRRGFTIVQAKLADETGDVKLTWFNQAYIVEQIPVGTKVLVSGKMTVGKYGRQFSNPTFEKYKPNPTHTARIVPKYSLTKGITHKLLRYYMAQALEQLAQSPGFYPDWLPDDIQSEHDLIPIQQAIQQIHFPTSLEELDAAKHRLGFDELLLIQLFVLATKETLKHEQAQPIPFPETPIKKFVQALPFRLTASQKRSAWEIMQDLEQASPMNRLLEGDVGSGKTVVAAMAMYCTVLAGFQAALMVPTEILAKQHFNKLTELFKNTNIKIGLATSQTEDKTVMLTADIIVGTHAILFAKQKFKKLALTIIDEQHRFGVSQRQQLTLQSGLKTTPHLLSMTATPIPRSLALTLYGDLSLSIIDELPHGRLPIYSALVKQDQRTKLYAHIMERLIAHEQVYVVAPRIIPSEESTAKDAADAERTSVTEEYDKLIQLFPQVRIAQLHGKLKPIEKSRVMKQFADGEIDMIVTTTVIEVGIDVPNATVIVIEDADRFGLAQLHQLRGRVGRSSKPSWCYVCTAVTIPAAIERLQYFCTTTSGFKVAEYDLERRGPGDVYGSMQSGYLNSLRFAKLTDHKLITAVQTTAQTIYPKLDSYPTIQTKLDSFMQRVHLE